MPVRVCDADFETFSGCDLKKAGAWRYAEDPTTEVICLATRVDKGHTRIWVPGFPTDELREMAEDPNVIWCAHNAAFEKAIWRNIMVPVFGLPDIPDHRWHDTQAACAMRGLPLALERAMLVLRLPHQKDMEGSALVKAIQKPSKKKGSKGTYDLIRDPAVLKRIYEYNAADIASTTDLRERTKWLPPGERAVWLLDQKINQRGVGVDLEFVSAAQRVVDAGSAPLVAEFALLTGGLRPGQRDKFMGWLTTQGVDLPNLKKETLAAILGDDNDGDEDVDGLDELSGDDVHSVRVSLPPAVHRALSIRSLVGSASIKKLARFMACTCADGRIRGMLQYHGAGPGLWAGRLVQPQNFPRGSIQIKTKDKGALVERIVEAIKTGDPDYVQMVTGVPPVEAVVSSLRHALVAAPGHRFVAGDYSGIQARVVLALAGQFDKVALMASGADVYCDMASNIFRRPITKEDPEERQYGKNSVLGLGFQMGSNKFHDRYCKDHPVEFAENIVRVYRKEWAPKVPYLWYGLDDASTKAVWDRRPCDAYGIEYRLEDGWLTCRLPSGRKLWYYNPVPVKKEMPWSDPEAPDIRQGWTSQAMKMGRWLTRHMFGGLETENVVMGIQRDIMVSAAFRLEKNGFPLVLNVHDEWVAEPTNENADVKAFKQILEDVDPWVKEMQIPVSVECWDGLRYRK